MTEIPFHKTLKYLLLVILSHATVRLCACMHVRVALRRHIKLVPGHACMIHHQCLGFSKAIPKYLSLTIVTSCGEVFGGQKPLIRFMTSIIYHFATLGDLQGEFNHNFESM